MFYFLYIYTAIPTQHYHVFRSPRELNPSGSARLVVFVSLSWLVKVLSWVVPTRFRDLCALIENRVWVDWGKHRSLPQSTKTSKRLVRC